MRKIVSMGIWVWSAIAMAFSQPYQFAFIGDMPYHPEDSLKFIRLIETLNAAQDLSWILHAGDIKSGATPCSQDFFQGRFDLYQQFAPPFIITPGDNEWTDCHRPLCGGYDPLDRLSLFRKIFFAEPGKSMGKNPMLLETQSDKPPFSLYPENQRWEKGGVVYATMHMVGSLNGMAPFDGRAAEDDVEAQQRTRAAIAWMEETFSRASGKAGVFLMIHANPGFERRSDSAFQVGYGAFLDALEQAVIDFGKPVVLAHGDSHYFRYDKPLTHSKTGRRIENFTRLEAFGDRDIHWVRVLVDAEDPNVFSIRQELISENLEKHP